MKQKDSIRRSIVVIGCGPAGLAAAVAAREAGIQDVLLLERDRFAGGILNQCIHDGFGLHIFKEALTGPEYAARFIEQVEKLQIEMRLETIVTSLAPDLTIETSRRGRLETIRADAIILAMGCRERTRGALSIPGTRPAGVLTAGAAQNLINLENIMIGKKVCILGSGDVGLIMARRMTLEGAEVKAVYELMPYSNGLPRNIQQCLNDFDIPLFLRTTVTEIVGDERLSGIKVAQVGDDLVPIADTEKFVACDTLLLSVGLIPENELSREAGIEIDQRTGGAKVDDSFMTSIPGIFSCGNVLHVHDLADWASLEAAEAGRAAAAFVKNGRPANDGQIQVIAGNGIRYVLPQTVAPGRDFSLFFRPAAPWEKKRVLVKDGDGNILAEKSARLHPSEMFRIDVKSKGGPASQELKVELV